MSIAGPAYELYGVSVFGTGPIADGVHVPLTRNITALYGLNGAGKSRLLNGIACALTGVMPPRDRHGERPMAHLHVRLTGGDGSLLEAALTEAVTADLAASRGALLEKALRTSRDLAAVEAAVVLPDLYGEIPLEDALTERLMLHVTGEPDAEEIELIGSISAGATFTLMAVGTEAAPRWRVAPALPLIDRDNRRALAACLTWRDRALDLMRQHAEEPDEQRQRAVLQEIFDLVPKLLNVADNETLNPYLLPAGGQGLAQLPDWLAVPVRVVGETSQQLVEVVDASRPTADLDGDTTRAVAAAGRSGVPTALTREADEVSALANRLLRLVLPSGSSQLTFELREPSNWMLGNRPGWTARLRGGDEVHALTALSSAQQRWAGLAARLALAGRQSQPLVFLCDEPEAGLHRRAEAQLAHGLAAAMADRGTTAIVATHSPFLLDQHATAPVLVDRDETGHTFVSPVPLSTLDALDSEHSQDRLGLTPGALLDLMRVALLVEGLHDQLLCNAVLGSELASSMAGVYPLRGAKGLRSLAEANLLLNGTNAPILLVLDNVQADVTSTWEDARKAAAAGSFDEALALVRGIADRGQGELRWLKELAQAAIPRGVIHRIHLFGLTEVDAVCYLPPEVFLKAGRGWTVATTAYTDAMAVLEPAAVRPGPKEWWVANKWASSFSDQLVEQGVRALAKRQRQGEALPPDLANLGSRLVALSAQR